LYVKKWNSPSWSPFLILSSMVEVMKLGERMCLLIHLFSLHCAFLVAVGPRTLKFTCFKPSL
jgi:hypothetical protein